MQMLKYVKKLLGIKRKYIRKTLQNTPIPKEATVKYREFHITNAQNKVDEAIIKSRELELRKVRIEEEINEYNEDEDTIQESIGSNLDDPEAKFLDIAANIFTNKESTQQLQEAQPNEYYDLDQTSGTKAESNRIESNKNMG